MLLELGRAEAMLPMAQEFSALRDAPELATDPRRRGEIALELALALFAVFRNGEARLVLDDALSREHDLDPDVVEQMEQALIGGGMDDLEAVPGILARAERHFERARRGEVRDGRMLAALAALARSRVTRASPRPRPASSRSGRLQTSACCHAGSRTAT